MVAIIEEKINKNKISILIFMLLTSIFPRTLNYSYAITNKDHK